MDSQNFENDFLDNVREHKITVLRDKGVDRHLRFRNPGTIYYGFDIITWSGHLCITGDCGTFVFRRTEDMFDFFRLEPSECNYRKEHTLHINPGYWHEKVLAEERRGGCKKYSKEIFESEIKRWFDDWAENISEDRKTRAWSEVEEDVLSYSENEHSAMEAALDFIVRDECIFQDFWEVDLNEYTFDYIWCLYAIVWGISEYDQANQ